MGGKGRTNLTYSDEIKREAVRLVLEENMSVREVAKKLNIRNKTQVHSWVQRYEKGESFSTTAFRKGKPKTKFSSVEEEMAYLKAEIAYLKKLYPNLHGE